MNTKQERAAAINLLVPSFAPYVVPSGTIGSAARKAVVWVYGMLAGGKANIAFSGSQPTTTLSGRSPGMTASGRGPTTTITGN